MLIQGSSVSSRTDKLCNEYIRLLDGGISSSKILVLVQNSLKKNNFINEVKRKVNRGFLENLQIHTFGGLVYNSIIDNWPLIESLIDGGVPQIRPNLVGLEISQMFLKRAINEVGFKDYNSKINLIHQLFRRNSLIANNNLTTDDVKKRSMILNESFADDAKLALDIFKKKTAEYRAFDYIRQLNIYSYIYKNTDYFKDIEYLIVDDCDEITNLQFDFLKTLKPQLKDYFIGYDKLGASRLGFLNADINLIENIEHEFLERGFVDCDNVNSIKPVDKSMSCTKRLEMFEIVFSDIKKLIDSGIALNNICLISPIIDKSFKNCINDFCSMHNLSFQCFSGNEKLVQNLFVRATLILLQMSLSLPIDSFKLRVLLNDVFEIPIRYCLSIIDAYQHAGVLSFVDLNNCVYNSNLTKLIELISCISAEELLLSEKISKIYECIISARLESKDVDVYQFFVKQVLDFESVFRAFANDKKLQKEIILQLENSIVSENSSSVPDIKENSIIIATPQKIVDYSIKTDYQFWLDTTSNEWVKDDLGTLYNSWVFQKSWNKKNFTYEDNLRLTEEKTFKLLRKLSILANNKIFTYSSLLDLQGNENFSGIDKFLSEKVVVNEMCDYSFKPRADQQKVLDYARGSMAISAVPGAGKTTILLVLIIKLIQSNVNSENIFVMTYMESAAKNFKERIKTAFPNLDKLPNISTIHGLALRILKENSNFIKVGLNDNFEICDDNQRQKIIRELMCVKGIDSENYEKYEKAISTLKLSDVSSFPIIKDVEIRKFLDFYKSYNSVLKENNLLDYDDMLFYSVKILIENKDIASYYQDMCHYLIEDEAQDSSFIQQKLLQILSHKHKNLIRCGDVNQAITTTFTNAEVKGFKDFIANADTIVEMNYSQRCTKDIFELANKLVDAAKNNKEWQNAFYDIKMHEVSGRNPVSKDALAFRLFDSFNEEQIFIVEKLREIFLKKNDVSVALLVRNNFQIEEYSQILAGYGFDVITRTDILRQHPVFAVIFAMLKFCLHPWDNQMIIDVMKSLSLYKITLYTSEDITYVESLEQSFISLHQDVLPTQNLTQLFWDLNYWLTISQRYFIDSIDELAVKIGLFYFSLDIEKANVYVIASLLKKISLLYKNPSQFLEQVGYISNRPLNGFVKLFESEDSKLDGKFVAPQQVQIMTYHKSKGDEFDYVFIPELTEETLALTTNSIKIKAKERFIEAIKSLNHNYRKKDELALKLFQIEENLRLLYVAITRAKKGLFISSAKKYKKYSRLKDFKPSVLFDTLFSDYYEVDK